MHGRVDLFNQQMLTSGLHVCVIMCALLAMLLGSQRRACSAFVQAATFHRLPVDEPLVFRIEGFTRSDGARCGSSYTRGMSRKIVVCGAGDFVADSKRQVS